MNPAEQYEKMARFELRIGSSPNSYIVRYYQAMARYWRGRKS